MSPPPVKERESSCDYLSGALTCCTIFIFLLCCYILFPLFEVAPFYMFSFRINQAYSQIIIVDCKQNTS